MDLANKLTAEQASAAAKKGWATRRAKGWTPKTAKGKAVQAMAAKRVAKKASPAVPPPKAVSLTAKPKTSEEFAARMEARKAKGLAPHTKGELKAMKKENEEALNTWFSEGKPLGTSPAVPPPPASKKLPRSPLAAPAAPSARTKAGKGVGSLIPPPKPRLTLPPAPPATKSSAPKPPALPKPSAVPKPPAPPKAAPEVDKSRPKADHPDARTVLNAYHRAAKFGDGQARVHDVVKESGLPLDRAHAAMRSLAYGGVLNPNAGEPTILHASLGEKEYERTALPLEGNKYGYVNPGGNNADHQAAIERHHGLTPTPPAPPAPPRIKAATKVPKPPAPPAASAASADDEESVLRDIRRLGAMDTTAIGQSLSGHTDAQVRRLAEVAGMKPRATATKKALLPRLTKVMQRHVENTSLKYRG